MDPWILDVTDSALFVGAAVPKPAARQRTTFEAQSQVDAAVARSVVISYCGLYRGQDPPAATGNAYIMMESSLVLVR